MHLDVMQRKVRMGLDAEIELHVPLGFCARRVGLLNHQSLERRHGLIYPSCRAIHTWGMFFPIALAIFDRSGRPLHGWCRVAPYSVVLVITPGSPVLVEAHVDWSLPGECHEENPGMDHRRWRIRSLRSHSGGLLALLIEFQVGFASSLKTLFHWLFALAGALLLLSSLVALRLL